MNQDMAFSGEEMAEVNAAFMLGLHVIMLDAPAGHTVGDHLTETQAIEILRLAWEETIGFAPVNFIELTLAHNQRDILAGATS